jgi:hypothetical protein
LRLQQLQKLQKAPRHSAFRTFLQFLQFLQGQKEEKKMKRSPFIKWLGQDGKLHEAWCDVFESGDCNCNDDDHKKPRRWQKLQPGEKWKDRAYTPVGKLTRIDPRQFKEEPWRVRTRAGLPKRINETLERGRELVQAAKGLR